MTWNTAFRLDFVHSSVDATQQLLDGVVLLFADMQTAAKRMTFLDVSACNSAYVVPWVLKHWMTMDSHKILLR